MSGADRRRHRAASAAIDAPIGVPLVSALTMLGFTLRPHAPVALKDGRVVTRGVWEKRLNGDVITIRMRITRRP